MDRRLHIPSFSLFGRRISSASLTIPAASLALFNTISIIALIPVYDKGLVPLLARFGRKLSLLQRIGEAACVLRPLTGQAQPSAMTGLTQSRTRAFHSPSGPCSTSLQAHLAELHRA